MLRFKWLPSWQAVSLLSGNYWFVLAEVSAFLYSGNRQHQQLKCGLLLHLTLSCNLPMQWGYQKDIWPTHHNFYPFSEILNNRGEKCLAIENQLSSMLKRPIPLLPCRNSRELWVILEVGECLPSLCLHLWDRLENSFTHLCGVAFLHKRVKEMLLRHHQGMIRWLEG